MSTQNAILAVIHDQIGQVLMNAFDKGDRLFSGPRDDNPFKIRPLDGAGAGLLPQLMDGTSGPPKISIEFILDVAGDAVTSVVKALNPDGLATARDPSRPDLGGIAENVRSALTDKLKLFDEPDAVADLITARGPAGLHDAGVRLFDKIRTSAAHGPAAVFSGDRVGRLQQLVGTDIGTVLPLATIAKAMERARPRLRNARDIPASITEALLAYFFEPTGYRTLDELAIVSPVHLSDLQSALAAAARQAAAAAIAQPQTAVPLQFTVPPQLAGLFSKTTAEHYLRDITKLIVDSAYDAGRGLRGENGRYETVKRALRDRQGHAAGPDATVTKFVSWFRGFGSIAESGAMRAVEVGTQGVSEFQTNPLIAAAAGSFAGAVARKLSQDSFLGVLAVDLQIPERKEG